MYKCLHCGSVLKDEELSVIREQVGWFGECEEKFACPYCHQDVENAKQCKICGSYHFDENMNGGVCDDCIEDKKNDIDLCFEIGKNCEESVSLNCFLLSMYSKEDIERILLEDLKKENTYTRVDCKPFIDEDKEWFAEMMIKEVKKNEN